MKILLCRKVCSNFSLKWWSKGTFWKLYNCTGDRLRQHHMKTHPKIEKYLYNCKICTEYPPTISFMAIMEHYKKVKFVKKWVMKSPKLLFAFADISHKSLPKIWKFWLDSEKQWWIKVKMVEMSSSWNFPARASPSCEFSSSSEPELGHFDFRAETELKFFKP